MLVQNLPVTTRTQFGHQPAATQAVAPMMSAPAAPAAAPMSQVQFGGFFDGFKKRFKTQGAKFEEGAQKSMAKNLPAVLNADMREKMEALKNARENAAKPAAQYKLATEAVTKLKEEVAEQKAKATRYAEAWQASGGEKFSAAAKEELDKLNKLEERLASAEKFEQKASLLHSEAASRINQLEEGLKKLKEQYQEAIQAHESNKDKEKLAEAVMAIAEIEGELTATSETSELIRKTKERGAQLDALIDGTYRTEDMEARQEAVADRKELAKLDAESALQELLAKSGKLKNKETEGTAEKTQTAQKGGGSTIEDLLAKDD